MYVSVCVVLRKYLLVGSDGAELARPGHHYGLPLLLESGNGRCVVTTEVNPENRASACQVGLVLHQVTEKKKSRGDRTVGYRQLSCVVTVRRRERRPPRAVTCAFSSSLPRVC